MKRMTGSVINTTLLLVAVMMIVSCVPQRVEPTQAVSRPASTAVPTPIQAPAAAQSPFTGNAAWIAHQTNRTGSEGVWLIHPDGTKAAFIRALLPIVHSDWRGCSL
jgi:hypothetical protein